MLRSMYSGISGMKNFQTKLDVIGNNIANVNTYGFKKGRVTFKDTMNQTISGASGATENRGGKNPMQVGLGSALASIDTIDTQSSLQTTGRPLDLAIDGDGYFVVSDGNQNFYTRAGNFYLDNFGTLVNADGFKVQQVENGILKNIVVDVNSVLPATETDEIKIEGNFPSGVSGTTEQTQQIEVVDNSGVKHTISLNIKNNGSNWDLVFDDQTLGTTPETTITINPASPTLTNPYSFNVSDGNGGTKTINFDLNLDDITNNPGNLNLAVKPNGSAQGSIESFNIGATGEVNAVYSNGKVSPIGIVALAKFSNPAGLQKAGSNLFQTSVNSGRPNIGKPGDGLGSLAPGSLEMSNVDLSEEFTDMIVAQRGFQANTRIITTSDEILQELINLKR